MVSMHLYLFGPPHLEQHGKQVAVNRRKMLALLSYLLVTHQPHTRDMLATLFWPEFDSSSALANLRRDLSRLKEILGDHVLHIERDKVGIDPEADVFVDVVRFESLLGEAEEHGHFRPGKEPGASCEVCQHKLQEAADLYKDGFLAGFHLPDSPEFDDWQFFQAERLSGLLQSVLIHLAHWQMAKRAYEAALVPARRWLSLDPLHEPAQRLVMQLYAWTGQSSAAMRQYSTLVDLLEKELGVQPEQETTLLYEAIRARRLAPPKRAVPVTGLPVETPVQMETSRRYIPETLLSTGGFGEIFRGRDQLTGKVIAIKRLLPQLVERQPEVVQRFLREGEVLSRLNHPNIVPMLDFFQQDGQYNLVMEYLPGGTLRDLLDSPEELSLDRTLEIALEMADALSRAHHLHVFHRDIKPENILLDAQGHPRLIDFGLALLDSHDTHLTNPGMLMGSPAYMSPEALRGQEYDARSDIWSFGVVLFEMVARRLPFEGDQIHILMQQIINQPVPSLREYCDHAPLALEKLLDAMLEKNREKRLPSMRQAAATLEEIRAGKNTSRDISKGTPYGTIHLVDLPSQPTPLIGRRRELDELRHMLEDANCRLISMVGPGGFGKTRLALELAHQVEKVFPNGAVFVSLASVMEADNVLPAIANAMHIRFSPGSSPKDQLFLRLKERKMLLILDNFEHLLDAASFLAELVANAPEVRLLVTSRERLNLFEEWVFEVRGLPFPSADEPVREAADSWFKEFGAVHLFLERARRVSPDIEADEETLTQVVRICQMVEGMPLALELAATWVRAMTCSEIADELAEGIDLLTTSMRSLPDRHRSVRVIFDQSWQSLTPEEQSVFSRLAVFLNGSTREATEKVARARPGVLMSLVDKALVRHRGSRFEMHELVRQYALSKLREDPQDCVETLDRHHRYYMQRVAQVTPWLKGGRQVEGAQEITNDLDNIRAAWRRAVEQNDYESINQAAEACWLYSEFRGTLMQGEVSFRLAAEKFQPEPGNMALAGFLRAAQGSMLARQWQLEQGRVLMEDGIRLLREAQPPDPEKTAFALAWWSFLNVLHGQFDVSASAAEESLTFFPQTGDKWTQAGALRLIGASYLYQGQLRRAQEYLDRCVAVCKSIGELRIRSYATSNLGLIHLWYGEMETARQYFEESQRVSKSCNDRLSRADALCESGRLYLATGEYERAVETVRKCIHLYRELGRTKISMANILLGKALRLLKAEGAEEALTEGLEAALSVNHRPDYAYGLEGMGSLAVDRQDHEQAERYFDQALEIWTQLGHEPEIATLLCRRAFNLLASGSKDTESARGYLRRALKIAQAHQTGTIGLTAIVGLETIKLKEGNVSAALPRLKYALHHHATPFEVRTWVKKILEEVQPEPNKEILEEDQSLSWLHLSQRQEYALQPGG